MKLSEMNKTSIKKMGNIVESRFGYKIDYTKLTAPKARKMITSINETIGKVRSSHGIHTSEKNPKYMELLMIREGLMAWVKQNPRKLIESEVGQAEALLAAKDMVDSLQDMTEKVGKMQIEQLPALTDTIRDQIGSDQSAQFSQAVSQTLAGLMDQLRQAREAMDNASRALSGEQIDTGMGMPGGDGLPDMGGDPMASDDAGMGGEDLGADLSGGDEFGATDVAAGGDEPIGRERR
jgi:hypothetical protein